MSQRKPRLSISKLKFKSQKQKGAKSKRELVVGCRGRGNSRKMRWR
jgi:hypothetical protein